MLSKLLLLISCMLAFLMFALLNTYVQHSDPVANYYILSSISQGLAALLAIILAATLIVVQVLRRLAAWRIAMSFETVFLILVYSIGIVSPLVFLRVGAETWMLNFSIAMIVLCISVLIPFFNQIGALFTSPVVLGELEQSILEAINQKAWRQVVNLLADFKYVWMRTITPRNDFDMETCINTWFNITGHMITNESTRFSLMAVVFGVSEEAIKQYCEEYAERIYNSFSLLEPVLRREYPWYKSNSLALLRMAKKRHLWKIRQSIMLRLRDGAYHLHLVPHPTATEEREPEVLTAELLNLDPNIAREILPKPIGDRSVYRLFANLLAKIDTQSDG